MESEGRVSVYQLVVIMSLVIAVALVGVAGIVLKARDRYRRDAEILGEAAGRVEQLGHQIRNESWARARYSFLEDVSDEEVRRFVRLHALVVAADAQHRSGELRRRRLQHFADVLFRAPHARWYWEKIKTVSAADGGTAIGETDAVAAAFDATYERNRPRTQGA